MKIENLTKEESSGKISSALKKNQPKKGVDLLSIAKKLSSKKFGKK